ncbi:hypothetical protein N7492_006782 [Penicillium capsulatum]|uniref:Uncharacterized protein n=1 Tax=Penicillium capsulatum TaxID=69766 RepID=A0A9W9LKP6_9EURO|nr:hypothetical protein N7492_006782 [Penicillium capsulatum]KAJ6116618.1 hypothetical protein N7512_006343 [Penicillium capsulatum]
MKINDLEAMDSREPTSRMCCSNTGNALARAWKKRAVHERLMRDLTKDDLESCRLVCKSLAVLLAPSLLQDITILFRSRALTRPSRQAALEHIGRYIQTVTFRIPHTPETFLPPVIDGVTGTEQAFVYMPQRHQASLSSPKYGSREMTTLLINQYPPLFHAATDVSSFVRTLTLMKNLKHLRISCEGQTPSHRYRRSVVDYALISLRMAVEQAPLPCLKSLSLLSIHTAAVFYLQPGIGFGASPVSRKRWSQIENLQIHMTSFPHENGRPTDHFKLLHAYLQSFPQLKNLVFYWKGEKGLSPISLATEPCLQPTSNQAAIELVNAATDASQVASFIADHRSSLREVNFQGITLRSGTWDDALAPLTRLSGSERWKERHASSFDVPVVLSPAGVSRRQLQKVIQAIHRRKDELCTLAKAENFWARPDHLKRLLQASALSWR